MSTEPLWRARTNLFGQLGMQFDGPPDTEVEVWPTGDRTKPRTGEWQTYLATNGWVILDKDSQLPVCVTKSDTADEMVRSLVETHNKALRAAGARTPTIDRNRVRAVVALALRDAGEPFSHAQVNRIANSVMLLLHGQGGETEEDAT